MDGIDKVVKILKEGAFANTLLEEMKNNTRFQHAQSIVRNDYHAFNLALEESLNFPQKNYLNYPKMVDSMNKERIMELAENYLSDALWIVSESK